MRSVNALAISSDGLHLYAATEGGGVYRLDLNNQAPPPAFTPTFDTTLIPTATPRPTSTPETTPAGIINTTGDTPWLYIGAPAGLIVVIVVLFALLRKKNK
jgi:hypothetical protein